MIYCSTGGFSSKKASEVILEFQNSGINNIELSGGLCDQAFLENHNSVREKFPSINFAIHNYFPPPIKPFVFNLASIDPEISLKSLEHAKNSLRLASYIGSKIYSFHAGFLIDPQPKELGKALSRQTLQNLDASVNMFISNVFLLTDYAKQLGVQIYIENNVITKANLERFPRNPLLMTSAIEIKQIFSKLPKEVKFLLDLGHLKVSSTTLGLDMHDQLNQLNHLISGYHISDNNSMADSNNAFNITSWFIEKLKKDLEYYVIEVYRSPTSVLKQQIDLLTHILN